MSRVISLNPATGDERSLDIDETTPSEVAALARRAKEAALDYSGRPLAWRAQLLRAIANELEADAPELVEVALRETALDRPRLEAELRRTAFQFRFFEDVVLDGAFLDVSIDHAKDSPMGPLPDLRRMRVPLGPVGVFGSSNFPFAFSVPGGDTASALAAGCPVVIKAHPAHPETSLGTFRALTRAANALGAPKGLLGLVFGFDAGVALVEEPAISAIGFTGSVSAGQSLLSRAQARATPIPFFGELGSANPLVVTTAAAAERAKEIGEGVAKAMTLGAGQFCTKPGLLFVPRSEDGDTLVSSLAQSLGELSTMTMLSEGIAEQFRSGVTAMASVKGNHHVVDSDEVGGANVRAQLFEVPASVYVGSSAKVLRKECFGPLAIVIRYSDRNELELALGVTEPALTFSLFSADSDSDALWLMVLAQSRAGRVIANGYPTGVGVSWSMQHGGPWPSTTSPQSTSVGAHGIERWLRPVTYQSVTQALLPEALLDANPLGIPQRVDGTRR